MCAGRSIATCSNYLYTCILVDGPTTRERVSGSLLALLAYVYLGKYRLSLNITQTLFIVYSLPFTKMRQQHFCWADLASGGSQTLWRKNGTVWCSRKCTLLFCFSSNFSWFVALYGKKDSSRTRWHMFWINFALKQRKCNLVKWPFSTLTFCFSKQSSLYCYLSKKNDCIWNIHYPVINQLICWLLHVVKR